MKDHKQRIVIASDTLYRRVSVGAVVVPGTLPAVNNKYALACAVIVKRVDAKTRAKTSINELLRNTERNATR